MTGDTRFMAPRPMLTRPKPASGHRRALRSLLEAHAAAAADPPDFFARHSRSFRFAAAFYPAGELARVGRVYAYCRWTDDLVDRPPAGWEPAALRDAWAGLSAGCDHGHCLGTVASDL